MLYYIIKKNCIIICIICIILILLIIVIYYIYILYLVYSSLIPKENLYLK